MAQGSDLKFGTSGLRGLVTDLQGEATRRYVAAFLRYAESAGQSGAGKVYLGRDFRASSPEILMDCAIAITAMGLEPVDCGALPTPALALYAMTHSCPAIMVTGSHIPEDRNGLKFYLPSGEISKSDEAGIVAFLGDAPANNPLASIDNEAAAAIELYRARYWDLLPKGTLAGWRIGVFEHSSVARDILSELLEAAGATVLRLGRRERFVAVDTEAFSDEVFAPLRDWLVDHSLDAIVSADGDGDRPLLMDAKGDFVRGDVLGLLSARFLRASSVVTPVTSNSAIERTGYFAEVIRTKVGSPYVVEGLSNASGPAIGFEANGGTLVGQGIGTPVTSLPPLPTRDAVLPLLCAFGMAAREVLMVDEVVARLPLQIAVADRLQNVPAARSQAFLSRLSEEPGYAEGVFADHGIISVSDVDGLQFRVKSGDMVHFRASGNAPEMRCYVEGSGADVAARLLDWAMGLLRRELV